MNHHALQRITKSWSRYSNVHFTRRLFGRLEAAAKKQAEPHVLDLNEQLVKMWPARIQSLKTFDDVDCDGYTVTFDEKAYWEERIQWLDRTVLRFETQCEKTKEQINIFAGRN